MEDSQIDVVVRCRKEMPLLGRALGRLRRQRGCTTRVLLLDIGASASSRSVADAHSIRVLERHAGSNPSSPGALMNQAMEETSSPLVAFINADAIPISEMSLDLLLRQFDTLPLLAAAYGRQVPAYDVLSGPTHDVLRNPDGAVRLNESGSFSMAAAIIRRKAWDKHPFDERLRYAEDLEWSTRVRRHGWATAYVAAAPFEQSRDATLRQHFARPPRPTPFPREYRHVTPSAQRLTMLSAVAAPPSSDWRVRL